MVAVLKQIEKYEKASINQSTESVPDSVPIVVRRDKVHTFSRTANFATITNSTTVDTFGALTLSLTNLPNYAEFVGLFDEYRIIQLTFRISPLSTTQVSPPFYTAIDPDDGAVPSSTDDLRQFDTLRIVPAGIFFERTFTPKFSIAAYTGTFTGYANASPYNMWLDTASTTIQHYGIKYAIPMASSVSTWKVDCTAVIQCRHPH